MKATEKCLKMISGTWLLDNEDYFLSVEKNEGEAREKRLLLSSSTLPVVIPKQIEERGGESSKELACFEGVSWDKNPGGGLVF